MRKHPRFPLDNTGSSRSPQTAPPPGHPKSYTCSPRAEMSLESPLVPGNNCEIQC